MGGEGDGEGHATSKSTMSPDSSSSSAAAIIGSTEQATSPVSDFDFDEFMNGGGSFEKLFTGSVRV